MHRIVGREPKASACLGWMIESNELVGLGFDDDGKPTESNLIVESNVNPSDIAEIRQEYEKILNGDTQGIEHPHVITEEDIPR